MDNERVPINHEPPPRRSVALTIVSLFIVLLFSFWGCKTEEKNVEPPREAATTNQFVSITTNLFITSNSPSIFITNAGLPSNLITLLARLTNSVQVNSTNPIFITLTNIGLATGPSMPSNFTGYAITNLNLFQLGSPSEKWSSEWVAGWARTIFFIVSGIFSLITAGIALRKAWIARNEPEVRKQWLLIFGVVALFILIYLIATIFTNRRPANPQPVSEAQNPPTQPAAAPDNQRLGEIGEQVYQQRQSLLSLNSNLAELQQRANDINSAVNNGLTNAALLHELDQTLRQQQSQLSMLNSNVMELRQISSSNHNDWQIQPPSDTADTHEIRSNFQLLRNILPKTTIFVAYILAILFGKKFKRLAGATAIQIHEAVSPVEKYLSRTICVIVGVEIVCLFFVCFEYLLAPVVLLFSNYLLLAIGKALPPPQRQIVLCCTTLNWVLFLGLLIMGILRLFGDTW